MAILLKKIRMTGEYFSSKANGVFGIGFSALSSEFNSSWIGQAVEAIGQEIYGFSICLGNSTGYFSVSGFSPYSGAFESRFSKEDEEDLLNSNQINISDFSTITYESNEVYPFCLKGLQTVSIQGQDLKVSNVSCLGVDTTQGVSLVTPEIYE